MNFGLYKKPEAETPNGISTPGLSWSYIDSVLASYGPKWTLSYVFQVQAVPRLAELAPDFRMEGAVQFVYGDGQFLPTPLAVKLLSSLSVFLHTWAKVNPYWKYPQIIISQYFQHLSIFVPNNGTRSRR